MAPRTYPHFKSSLKLRTLRLLNQRLDTGQSVASIAKALGISANWISMFSRDEIKLPDVTKTERLHDYLSPVPLSKLLNV